MKSRTGWNPYKLGNYILSKTTSVQFIPSLDNDSLPTDNSFNTWKFISDNFEMTVTGKFKDSVKIATKRYKQMTETSYSHNITVIRLN